MTVSVRSTVRSILAQYLLTCDTLPLDGTDPNVCWENASFEPTAGAMWLRVHLDVVGARRVTMGQNGSSLYYGILQIDVFAPKGEGSLDADAQVDALLNHFRSGIYCSDGTTQVHLTRASDRKAYTGDPLWYQVPVQITWEAVVKGI